MQTNFMYPLGRLFAGLAGRRSGAGLSSLVRTCFLALPLLLISGLSHAQSFYDNFAQGAGGSSVIVTTRTDSAGNSYVLGTLSGTGGALTGAGVNLTPIGTADGWIAKFNASGALLWAHNFGGPGVSVNAGGIAVDASGNLYVGASFYGGNLTAPTVTKISTTNYQNLSDALAMKLDTNGNLLWVRNYGGATASSVAGAVAVDSAGYVVVSGTFADGNMTSPYLTRYSAVNYDSFLFRLDNNGNMQWAQHYGGGGYTATQIQSLAVDSAQNIYVGGQYMNGPTASPSLSAIGNTNGFLMEVSNLGYTQWARGFGGSGAGMTISSIALDSTGNIAASGTFYSGSLSTPSLARVSTVGVNAFAMKTDTYGNVQWARAFAAPSGGASSAGIFADNAGNVVVTGNFSGGNMVNPAITLTGIQDVYAIELNSSGTPVWALNMGLAGDAFTVVNSGNYVLNGTRYIVLGGEGQYGSNAGYSPFLVKTPIQ